MLHDNTLYVYTPEGFLSLDLEEDAEWRPLDKGESVTDAVCVKGRRHGDPNQPALFLVGGKSDNPEYGGLQVYSFVDKKWETLHTDDPKLKNRVRHGAMYINSSASLVVFSGTTSEDAIPSTDTFDISVASLQVESKPSPSFDFSLDPVMLPWSEEYVAIIGVGGDKRQVWTYGGGRWEPTGASIPEPLKDPSMMQCATVKTDDGSQVLQIFDMSASPNTVTEYVLTLPGQRAAPNGKTPQELRDNPIKRELTLGNWPDYDDKFASDSPRTGFSLAQDGNQVVISGGGGGDEPVLVFDQTEGSWIDPDKIFGSPTTTTTTTSATSTTSTSTSTTTAESTTISATTTSTAEPSASTTAIAGGGSDGGSNTLTIIGATLGAVLGVAAILIIILLILAWRKRRGKYPGGRGGRSNDPDRLSFQDQGMEPLTRSIQPMGRANAPSTDSWAIVSGQANGNSKIPPPSNTFNDLNFGIEKKASPLRNVESSSPDGFNKEIAVPGAAVVGRDKRESVRGDRLTDEGWSKYFQGDGPNRSHSQKSTASSLESKSDYGSTAWPHASAEVPALTLRTLDEPQPIRQIPSGSPSAERAPNFEHLVAHQGMAAQISSGDSISIASDDDRDDRRDDWRRSRLTNDRVASSNYSNSMYLPSGADVPGNRMTQWPGDLEPPQEQPNQRSNLSSDVSWLNLGANR